MYSWNFFCQIQEDRLPNLFYKWFCIVYLVPGLKRVHFFPQIDNYIITLGKQFRVNLKKNWSKVEKPISILMLQSLCSSHHTQHMLWTHAKTSYHDWYVRHISSPSFCNISVCLFLCLMCNCLIVIRRLILSYYVLFIWEFKKKKVHFLNNFLWLTWNLPWFSSLFTLPPER